jgi:hypothetical protein
MHDVVIIIAKGAVLLACFLAPVALRLWMENKKIPVEKKLEWSLHRGARALRQLGRARRNAWNSPALAARIAAKAFRELRIVQRIVTRYGCPVAILRRLEVARNNPHSLAPLPVSDEETLLREIGHALYDSESVIREWQTDLNATKERLAREVDPTIYRSGGALRNPFKKHSLDESGQSESISNIRRSQEDIMRVSAALDKVTEAASSRFVNHLDSAITALDFALAEANMPLPLRLATGESPHDYSNPPPLPGSLQVLHAKLMALKSLQPSASTNS